MRVYTILRKILWSYPDEVCALWGTIEVKIVVCESDSIDIDTHRIEVISIEVSSSPIVYLSDIDILGCISYIDISALESHLLRYLTHESIPEILSPVESTTWEIIHPPLFFIVF